MNKNEIGKYLKKLRENLKLTQEELTEIFMNHYDKDISVHAVSEWENCNTIPNSENLEILSKIYNRSIDEILEGMDKESINYNKIYFSPYSMKIREECPESLFHVDYKYVLKIRKRFKQLLLKVINIEINNEENKELKFLFENFYEFTPYAISLLNKNQTPSYPMFLILIRKVTKVQKNIEFEELYWEIQKLFCQKQELFEKYLKECIEVYKKDINAYQAILSEFENWEKDLFISYFQEFKRSIESYNKYGEDYPKKFETESEEYSQNELIISSLKSAIDGGAYLNKLFIKRDYYLEKEVPIISFLEHYHQSYCVPLTIKKLGKDNNYDYYQIENNEINRFIIFLSENSYMSEYSNIVDGILKNSDISLEEMYNNLIVNDDMTEEFCLKLAKIYNIDISKEKKYWIADLNFIISNKMGRIIRMYKHIQSTEKEDYDTYKILIQKFNEGERVYLERHKRIQKIDYKTLIERKNKLTYKEFLKTREIILTNKLISNIDSLSYDEIINSYFKMEA